MTDPEGEVPDPLLVRPFLLHDPGVLDDTPSTQTWPAATREVRSHRVLVGAPLTGRPAPAAATRPYPRRLLVVTGTGVAVLAALTAAAYAALGAGDRHPSTAGPQRPPLPAVTGPATSAPSPTATATTGPPPAAVAGPSARRSRSSPTVPSPAPTGSTPALVPAAPAAPPTSATPGVTTSPATGGSPTASTVAPVGIAPDGGSERIGAIHGLNNLCLDLNGGVAVDGNHVQVFDCNGSGAQRWTLPGDGTLRVAGMCALVVGDNTVHIVGCDGRTTAQWRVAGRALVNVAGAQCLTDPAAGRHSGAGVTVSPCSGAPEQSWYLS